MTKKGIHLFHFTCCESSWVPGSHPWGPGSHPWGPGSHPWGFHPNRKLDQPTVTATTVYCNCTLCRFVGIELPDQSADEPHLAAHAKLIACRACSASASIARRACHLSPHTYSGACIGQSASRPVDGHQRHTRCWGLYLMQPIGLGSVESLWYVEVWRACGMY